MIGLLQGQTRHTLNQSYSSIQSRDHFEIFRQALTKDVFLEELEHIRHEGDLDLAKWIDKNNGNNFFHYAIENKCPQYVLEYLRKTGVDPLRYNNEGLTPFHKAVMTYDLPELFDYFLEIGAPPMLRTRLKKSEVMEKLAYYRTINVEWGNKNKKVADLAAELDFDWSKDYLQDKTVLHVAIASGRSLSLINHIITILGQDAYNTDLFGATALFETVHSGSSTMAKFLINNGFDINSVNLFGMNALQLYLYTLTEKKYQKSQLLEVLFPEKRQVNAAKQTLALGPVEEETDILDLIRNKVLFSEDIKFVVTLMENGINPEQLDTFGSTPFLTTLRLENAKLTLTILEFMVERKGNTDLIYDEENGTTYLMRITALAKTYKYYEEIFYFVLSKNIKIDTMNNRQENIAHIACSYNANPEILKLIMANGVSPATEDYISRNGFLRACAKNKNVAVLQFLIESGMAHNTVDAYGQNPFMIAAIENPILENLELLVNMGIPTDGLLKSSEVRNKLKNIFQNSDILFHYLEEIGIDLRRLEAEADTSGGTERSNILHQINLRGYQTRYAPKEEQHRYWKSFAFNLLC